MTLSEEVKELKEMVNNMNRQVKYLLWLMKQEEMEELVFEQWQSQYDDINNTADKEEN